MVGGRRTIVFSGAIGKDLAILAVVESQLLSGVRAHRIDEVL